MQNQLELLRAQIGIQLQHLLGESADQMGPRKLGMRHPYSWYICCSISMEIYMEDLIDTW